MSPLIQRYVAASAAELKADVHSETVVHVNTQMQAVKDELKSDIQEINERSRRMEAQLQDLIARVGSS